MSGMTFAAIGAELGVTYQAVQQAVTRSLEITKADISEKADELRAMEAEKLDALSAVLWPKVLAGDLRATDRWLRAREAYRRLNGLDLRPEMDQQVPQVVVIDTRPPWSRDEPIDGEAVEVPQIEAGQ